MMTAADIDDPTTTVTSDIWLVRHLLCDIDISERVDAEGFAEWSRRYDKADIRGEIPAELHAMVGRAQVVTSGISRTVRTAERAGFTSMVTEPALARISRPRMRLPLLRARPLTWRGIGRVLWLLGWTRGTETRREVRARAIVAADRLVELARKGEVVAIGHGYQNQMVARELRRRGWTGPARPPKKPGLPIKYEAPTT